MSSSTGKINSFQAINGERSTSIEANSLQLHHEQPLDNTAARVNTQSPNLLDDDFHLLNSTLNGLNHEDIMNGKFDEAQFHRDLDLQLGAIGDTEGMVGQLENDLPHDTLESNKDELPTYKTEKITEVSMNGDLIDGVKLKDEPIPSTTNNVTIPQPRALSVSEIVKNEQGNVSTSESAKVSAYARLEFENFIFYVQTLQVVLGRKSENDQSHTVDVHLGASKAISRKHAKIFYNFGTERFELSIQGKNGAFVDDSFLERGVTVALENMSKVQIGQIVFRFVLPGTNSKDSEEEKPINPSEAISLRSTLYKNMETSSRANEDEAKTPEILTKEGLESELAQSAAKPRVLNDSAVHSAVPLTSATHLTVETPKPAPPSLSTLPPPPQPPVQGLPPLPPVHRQTPSTQKSPSTPQHIINQYPAAQHHIQSHVQQQASVTIPKVEEKDKKPPKPTKPPKKVYTIDEIPEEYRTKPQCSYSNLIATCLRTHGTSKGMSLAEIYKSIRELFPFYKYCPDGWQSSVRHNLSLNKAFRKVSKEGKGWLWGLDEEYCAEKDRIKKKQAAAAEAKARAAQAKLEQQQQKTLGKSDKALTQAQPLKLNSINVPLVTAGNSTINTVSSSSTQVQLSPQNKNLSTPAVPTARVQANQVKAAASLPQQQVLSQAQRSLIQPSPQPLPPPQQRAAPLYRPPVPTLQQQQAAQRAAAAAAAATATASSTTPGSIHKQHLQNIPPVQSQPQQSLHIPSPGLQQQQQAPQLQQQRLQQQPAARTPSIQAQLALNRSNAPNTPTTRVVPPPASNSTKQPPLLTADNKKALAYLQTQLITLSKDLRTLVDKPTISAILTQAIAMTIAQVTQAAKAKGITGDPLATLIDTNPAQLTKILTLALNAASYKVTNGRVKNPIQMPSNLPSASAKTSPSPSLIVTPNPVQVSGSRVQTPTPVTNSYVPKIQLQPIPQAQRQLQQQQAKVYQTQQQQQAAGMRSPYQPPQFNLPVSQQGSPLAAPNQVSSPLAVQKQALNTSVSNNITQKPVYHQPVPKTVNVTGQVAGHPYAKPSMSPATANNNVSRSMSPLGPITGTVSNPVPVIKIEPSGKVGVGSNRGVIRSHAERERHDSDEDEDMDDDEDEDDEVHNMDDAEFDKVLNEDLNDAEFDRVMESLSREPTPLPSNKTATAIDSTATSTSAPIVNQDSNDLYSINQTPQQVQEISEPHIISTSDSVHKTAGENCSEPVMDQSNRRESLNEASDVSQKAAEPATELVNSVQKESEQTADQVDGGSNKVMDSRDDSSLIALKEAKEAEPQGTTESKETKIQDSTVEEPFTENMIKKSREVSSEPFVQEIEVDTSSVNNVVDVNLKDPEVSERTEDRMKKEPVIEGTQQVERKDEDPMDIDGLSKGLEQTTSVLEAKNDDIMDVDFAEKPVTVEGMGSNATGIRNSELIKSEPMVSENPADVPDDLKKNESTEVPTPSLTVADSTVAEIDKESSGENSMADNKVTTEVLVPEAISPHISEFTEQNKAETPSHDLSTVETYNQPKKEKIIEEPIPEDVLTHSSVSDDVKGSENLISNTVSKLNKDELAKEFETNFEKTKEEIEATNEDQSSIVPNKDIPVSVESVSTNGNPLSPPVIESEENVTSNLDSNGSRSPMVTENISHNTNLQPNESKSIESISDPQSMLIENSPKSQVNPMLDGQLKVETESIKETKIIENVQEDSKIVTVNDAVDLETNTKEESITDLVNSNNEINIPDDFKRVSNISNETNTVIDTQKTNDEQKMNDEEFNRLLASDFSAFDQGLLDTDAGIDVETSDNILLDNVDPNNDTEENVFTDDSNISTKRGIEELGDLEESSKKTARNE